MHPTTISSSGLLVLRLVVGVTFLLHGFNKLGALSGTEEFFASLEIPAPGLMAPFVALTETVGGIELVLLLAAASLALALPGARRFSADATLGLTRYFRAGDAVTGDSTRHSPRREQAHTGAKVTT